LGHWQQCRGWCFKRLLISTAVEYNEQLATPEIELAQAGHESGFAEQHSSPMTRATQNSACCFVLVTASLAVVGMRLAAFEPRFAMRRTGAGRLTGIVVTYFS